MIKTILTAAIIAGSTLSFAAVALAQSEFDAKPMNAGPPMMQPMQPMQPMAGGDEKMMMKKKKMSKKMMMKKKMMMDKPM